ncbi:MAG: phage tail sheath subtilisin-like domain-containing protein [Candidatus Thiodiazotropha sp.]
MLLRQPDPALPSRNDTVIASEVFRHLSLDHRHSRYVERVVGDIDGDLRLSDRRPEGESWYIRVRDQAANQAELESVRLGPEILVDILPDGREQPARQALIHGNDSVDTITDATYIGVDDREPANRTGLFSFRNHDDISLVACPGRTSSRMQGTLINHCELMRYRFAVLDGTPPPNDSLNDIQAQRQQFDTKYAALYHPWLLVPDPYPTNLAQVADYSLPPSGHMLGVYARTDIERGVHKAPANEVVRGITGLQRSLNKGEHDILNPVNINVIRDFRRDNRGIRIWGGRVITSDSDWKYVNVRRLLIFIEASIDRGLQWVVFEPNAEPLWARVRRTVSNFLTVVWRNGALEGTKTEEAFFVKCDRTTMTQTDIDNGRLICVIGVAPVKPAEFVIIRIGLWTAHAED